MSKPVLTYFDFTGRAEPIRLAFFVGGVDFEDKRLAKEEFGKAKGEGKFPFGSVPVLEVNGKTYAQSTSLLRYAGKLAKLYPEDPVAGLGVDMVLDTVEEIASKLPFGGDDIKEKREKFQAEVLPKFLPAINKMAAENSDGWLVGSSLTIADIMVANFCGWLASGMLDHLDKELVSKDYAALAAVTKKVQENPKVAEWTAAHQKK
eukprot:NODE_493_length_790_cov_307.309201_g484_i0.p1 GENE.NODE_493_length_790_cov_307.309201_g484_i0~~NODE_493_length_790_cov_307.309201_g484_i0.p1  ORF type:complete len:222 (+),score=79.06 NODE_493_length_790_cov_307.309201_g484_i0:53-667(+)